MEYNDEFESAYNYTQLRALRLQNLQKEYPLGTNMEKVSGAEWRGSVVGYYTTALNPGGLAIESSLHSGSVQIYPAKALRVVE